MNRGYLSHHILHGGRRNGLKDRREERKHHDNTKLVEGFESSSCVQKGIWSGENAGMQDASAISAG